MSALENKNPDTSSKPTPPVRKRLYHTPPSSVCCAERGRAQLNQPAVFAMMTEAIEHYVTAGRW
jgi:hypothetical protein